MKIFVPANNKGGVGKTEISCLFAEYCSKILNKATLLIDFDAQCNTSLRYLEMEIDPASPQGFRPPVHPDYDPVEDNEGWDGTSTIADIFFSSEGVIPYPTSIPNLDIAPAHSDKLLIAEAVRRSEVVEKVHNQLHQFLSSNDVRSEYDIVVIDTAPSKGPLTISAIKAATHLIIPSIMEEKPIQGIYSMMQLWKQETSERDKSRTLNLVGILANMFDKRTLLHNQLYESLKKSSGIGDYVIPFALGRRVAFAETDCKDASPKSIFDLSESNIARTEAIEVCNYIAKKVFEDE